MKIPREGTLLKTGDLRFELKERGEKIEIKTKGRKIEIKKKKRRKSKARLFIEMVGIFFQA